MSRAINLEVKLRKHDTGEKLLKIFTKKCKKQNIIKEYLEHTYYQTRSQKKREKRKRNNYLKQNK